MASSLTLSLKTAQSGLATSQAALDAVANNIANVNTPGYSRKIVNTEQRVLTGVGAGVQLAEITRAGCVSKVVEIGFGASPSGLSFAAVRPRGQGFRRRLADRGFPIHRLCASGFGRKRGAPRGASALFRDTAARSVF